MPSRERKEVNKTLSAWITLTVKVAVSYILKLGNQKGDELAPSCVRHLVAKANRAASFIFGLPRFDQYQLN